MLINRYTALQALTHRALSTFKFNTRSNDLDCWYLWGASV